MTAASVIADVRLAAVSVAVARIDSDAPDVVVDPGAEPATVNSLFEIGSITKTLTATLLAQMTIGGDVALDAGIGDFIDAGRNAGITIEQLATHTSGLPRLPGNIMAKAALSPQDPYRDYDEADLLEALASDEIGSNAPEYSNYGFMVLGHVLATAGKAPLAELLKRRVFEPLGMHTATVHADVDNPALRLPARRDNAVVPHWSKLLPGAGGVDASITDMATYLAAQLAPEHTPLEIEIRMTQTPTATAGECLSWQRAGAVLWHNGATGGFTSFIGFDREAGRGVVVLANCGRGDLTVDKAGMRALGIDNPLLG